MATSHFYFEHNSAKVLFPLFHIPVRALLKGNSIKKGGGNNRKNSIKQFYFLLSEEMSQCFRQTSSKHLILECDRPKEKVIPFHWLSGALPIMFCQLKRTFATWLVEEKLDHFPLWKNRDPVLHCRNLFMRMSGLHFSQRAV